MLGKWVVEAGSGGGLVTNNGHKALVSEPDPRIIRKEGLETRQGGSVHCGMLGILSLSLSHDHALTEATTTM